MIIPHDIKISDGRKLIEFIAHQAWRPRIGNTDSQWSVWTWTSLCPSKIHPIICMDVLFVPDSAHLHAFIAMDEWLILTAIQRGRLEAIQIEKFCSGLEDLRHEGKLDSRNTLPIVLVALWADQRRSSGDKIRRTVVMVVVVMRDLKQKISRHGLVLVGIPSSSDLLEGM
jgi:hypothetical protein